MLRGHRPPAGRIRQLQIMPLAGTSWLAVKLIQGALLILPGITVVAATAAITQSPGLTPARWAALAAVLLAGSLPFTVLGLVIGQALDGQSANSATLFTVLGLSFAGGLLIPDSQLPLSLQHAAVVLPSRAARERVAVTPGPFGITNDPERTRGFSGPRTCSGDRRRCEPGVSLRVR